MFEDAKVEKEVDIRKRILRDFNRKEEEFKTLREYNDYLEEVETIIYNLVNNIDVMETNKKIEQYKKDNKDAIQKNKGKLGKDEYELEELIELEKIQDEFRRNEIKKEEVLAKKKKIKDKEALLDELMFSNTNAKNIVESFAEKAKEVEVKPPPQKMTQFSTGIQFGRQNQSNFLPIPSDETPTYKHKTISYEGKGPSAPNEKEIIIKGFLNNVRSEVEQERAGGFKSTISCTRAIQDALCGLYHSKKQVVYTH